MLQISYIQQAPRRVSSANRCLFLLLSKDKGASKERIRTHKDKQTISGKCNRCARRFSTSV